MKGAFESAWAKVHVAQEDAEAASHRLVDAIIEMVNAGVRDRNQLVANALVALASARGLSGEWMIKRDQAD